MEYDNRYASNGKGNAALATSIIGTAGVGLALLGGMNGLFGGNRAAFNCAEGIPQCNENTFVTRYDLQKDQAIAANDSKIALLKANTYNDQKSLEMYKYVDGRLREIEARLGEQAVINQKIADSFALVQQDVKMEAERRCCGDNSIVNYDGNTGRRSLPPRNF
ncbi:MAG: hypothetical protein K2G32_08465 [Oscillospiraceae bacterium]|nr:hypothetical protein [Oscillospiraceae bacterium]